MRQIYLRINEKKVEALLAETGRERRMGMRQFPDPRPLLLDGAPLIHTRGCAPLDLVWIRDGKVFRVIVSKPNRLYFAAAWRCLELPAGAAGDIRKGDPVIVLGES